MIFLRASRKPIIENGLIKSDAYIIDGELQGKKSYYYKNTALQKEENYLNGKLNGWVRNYFENGKIQKEEYFNDGKIEKSKEYNKDGLLVSTYGY